MIKLTFVGDIMCKKQILEAYKIKSGYNFSEIFEKMKDEFKNSDFVIGNLETPITKNEELLTKEQFNFASPYEFENQLNL